MSNRVFVTRQNIEIVLFIRIAITLFWPTFQHNNSATTTNNIKFKKRFNFTTFYTVAHLSCPETRN